MNSKYLFLNHLDKHEKHNMLKTKLLKSSHKFYSSHSLPHSQNSNYILIFAKGKNLQSTLPLYSPYPVCQQIPLALCAPGLNRYCYHSGPSCCLSIIVKSRLSGLPLLFFASYRFFSTQQPKQSSEDLRRITSFPLHQIWCWPLILLEIKAKDLKTDAWSYILWPFLSTLNLLQLYALLILLQSLWILVLFVLTVPYALLLRICKAHSLTSFRSLLQQTPTQWSLPQPLHLKCTTIFLHRLKIN